MSVEDSRACSDHKNEAGLIPLLQGLLLLSLCFCLCFISIPSHRLDQRKISRSKSLNPNVDEHSLFVGPQKAVLLPLLMMANLGLITFQSFPPPFFEVFYSFIKIRENFLLTTFQHITQHG